MVISYISYGTISVSIESVSFLKALIEPNAIKNWYSEEVTISNSNNQLNYNKSPTCFENEIQISKTTDSIITWQCFQNHLLFEVEYVIGKLKTEIRLQCKQFNIYTFLQEWIYRFYRLQEYVEKGLVSIPQLQYSEKLEKDITLTLPIQAEKSNIFRTLTEKYYLSQIFSQYPESNLEDFHYTWGWLDEGPSNLISWKQNSILIHDFIIDFNPIGYIKWEIVDGSPVYLSLTHKDINLEEEIDQLRTYNSYKFGWMYYLAKVKDLTEHGSFTVHFMDEIID